MTDLIDLLITLSIPITATDRQRAAEFAAQQLTPEKAKQVYRNTIAVLVGNRYLQMLGLPSEVTTSQSWDRVDRWLTNVAELPLPDLQQSLECRPVSSGENYCFIPEEVMENRLGYLVVQIDEPYREGILLGFVPQVTTTEFPLSQLQPLDALIDAYTEFLQCSTSAEQKQVPINLENWLKGTFEKTWQPCLEILKPPKSPLLLMANSSTTDTTLLKTEVLHRSIAQLYQQATLVDPIEITPVDDPVTALVHLIHRTQQDEIRWQAAELLWEVDPNHPDSPVISARDIGWYLGGQAIALMVGVLPKDDRRPLILLRLYPLQSKPCLPQALKLSVLDGNHNLLIELESRERDQYIQFKFTADPGDFFEVRVSLNDARVTENFVV